MTGVRFAFNWRGAWGAAAVYTTNDLVLFGGTVYRATKGSLNQAPSAAASAYWEVFVPGLSWTGVWAIAAAYKKGELVTYAGSLWVALQDNTNQPPVDGGAYWQIAARAGDYGVASIFNIKDYGATTAAADNAVAIQAAIDAAYAVGGSVWVPPGVFKTGAVTLKCNLDGVGTLKGKDAPANTYDFLQVSAAYPGVSIRNITLDGNRTPAGAGYVGPAYDAYVGVRGIQVYASDVTISNVTVKNCFQAGIFSYRAQRLIVQGCRVSNIRGQFGDGIYVGGGKDCLVAGNRVEDFTRIGIVGEMADGVHGKRLIISNNSIYNGHDAGVLSGGTEYNAGVWCENVDSAVISGNHIRQVTHYGIIVAPYATVATPAAPGVATAAAGGAIPAGTYYAKVVGVNANGKTLPSAESAAIVTAGATSTITVTGPSLDGSPNNLTAVEVYLTPASAAPGTEVYAGQYLAGNSLVLAALPAAGNAAPPSENTTDAGSAFELTGNLVDACASGIELGGQTANGRINVIGGTITGYLKGVTVGSVGGVVKLQGVHFGPVRQLAPANGLIAIDTSATIYPLKELAVLGCSKEVNTYQADAADLNGFALTGAGLGALTVANLVGDWSLVMRQPAGVARVSNCRLAVTSNAYAAVSGLLTRLDNCKVVAGGAVNFRLYNGNVASDIRLTHCDLDGVSVLPPSSNVAHVLEARGCKFNNTMLAIYAGALKVDGCTFTEPTANGAIYAGELNVPYSIEARNCRVSSTAGNPFVFRKTYDPTSAIIESINADANVPLTSNITPTALSTVSRRRTATATPIAIDKADHTVYVKMAVAGAVAVNLPAAPEVGRRYVVKDAKGDALVNNVTITPAAGTIDGAAAYVLSNNYESVTLEYNGSEWSVIA